MVMAPLTPCSEPRCGTLVQRGRCAVHARQKDRQRGSFRERGYSTEWDKLAAWFKTRYPLCGMRPDGRTPVMSTCFDEGRTTPVYAVDHVVSRRDGGTDALENLQGMCRSCHAAKTRAGL